ncbi:Uncharacterised protein [Achromobacter sp. 2789STDY5608628]|nr:Uncharacterised protein [Achromobacter sp. 2789STDY5608628]
MLTHRGHARLAQELERRWPGCGAHVKRNQTTGVYEVVWSALLSPQVSALIGAYVDAWRECLHFARNLAQDVTPFTDGPALPTPARRGQAADNRPARRQIPAGHPSPGRHDVAAAARANLEKLFEGPAREKS